MNYKFIVIPLLLIGLVAGSGCLDYSGGSTGRPDSVDLRLEHNETDSGYSVAGEVDTEVLGAEQKFDQVMICLYAENGELLASSSAGSMDPVDASTFDVTVSERPTYIVVDHPDFRDYEVDLTVVEWREAAFRIRSTMPEDYIDEFDYTPPTELGSCGSTS